MGIYYHKYIYIYITAPRGVSCALRRNALDRDQYQLRSRRKAIEVTNISLKRDRRTLRILC